MFQHFYKIIRDTRHNGRTETPEEGPPLERTLHVFSSRHRSADHYLIVVLLLPPNQLQGPFGEQWRGLFPAPASVKFVVLCAGMPSPSVLQVPRFLFFRRRVGREEMTCYHVSSTCMFLSQTLCASFQTKSL